ncbi:MAG: family 10 glycosylhydrolase [Actinomycetota bacterium]|nr:family 10 glycosylhydrolase [Actinomycetota bacterium]
MRKTIATLFTIAMLSSLVSAPVAADSRPEQWRGYWVDAFNPGIYSPAQVDKLVADAKDLNANVLVVQVGRRFDCFCNDALYPRTDALIDPAPYDPLREVIDEAHANGLQVHAWVNATTLWNSATPPRSEEHAFNQHGPSATGGDRWLNKRVDGAELIGSNAYIDPAHPDAVDYVVAAVDSIVENYDVDGINLDYIRYPDYNGATFRNDWGYSDTSLARFAEETGRSDVPAPDDEQFSQWRRDQVSGLVRKIYLTMYRRDPSVRLSVNGITYAYGPQTYGGWENTRPYSEVMQDWKGWLDEGIVDTVTAMNYKREWLPDQAQMYAEWNEAIAAYEGDRQNVIGPALYLNEVDDSLRQARAAIDADVAGWNGYSYANPSKTAVASGDQAIKDSERDKLEQALTESLFAESAAVPEMRWKTEPVTGHVAGSVVDRTGRPLDQASIAVFRESAGERVGTATTDGSGWFGVVDLSPGRYRLLITEPGVTGPRAGFVTVRTGEVFTLVMRVRGG